MYVPSVLDRVNVKGGEHVFIVARVDLPNECVDLVPWDGEGNLVLLDGECRPIVRFPFAMIDESSAAGSLMWPIG